LTRKLANKNKKKGEQKQRNKTRIHSLSYLLLHKTKRRPRRGTTAAKTSPPPYDRSGAAGAGAPEELEPDDRLLQENKTKVKTRRGFQQ